MKYNRLQINNTYDDVYYQVLLRIRWYPCIYQYVHFSENQADRIPIRLDISRKDGPKQPQWLHSIIAWYKPHPLIDLNTYYRWFPFSGIENI